MKILFWVSILTVLYVYAGYPLLVYLISLFLERPVRRKYIYPSISVIVSAYNEEKSIEKKITTLLDADYPKEKLEILIGSDGSTDGTEEIVKRYVEIASLPRFGGVARNDDGQEASCCAIKLFRQVRRRGKPNMLNILASAAKGEILVFTDARQRLDRNSLKELVRNFSDEKVGSVSAELLFEDDDNKTSNGIGLYWAYEKFIRKCESKIDSMLGATGAMYAIRRELFQEMPEDLILDDVYIPLKAIEKGYRAIFESEAKIYDTVVKDAKEEFSRKARTLAGNFQAFGYLKGLFNPFRSPVAFQFFSHKFLRLVVPFLLINVFKKFFASSILCSAAPRFPFAANSEIVKLSLKIVSSA